MATTQNVMIGASLGLFWGSPFWRAGVPMAMECVFGFRYVQGVSWQEVKRQLNEGANTHDFCTVLSLGWPLTNNLMYKTGVWILPFSGISFAQCPYISCSGLLLNTWIDDIWNGEGRFKKWQIFIYPQWQGSAQSDIWTTGTDEGDLQCVSVSEQLTPINFKFSRAIKKESFLHLSLEYCL